MSQGADVSKVSVCTNQIAMHTANGTNRNGIYRYVLVASLRCCFIRCCLDKSDRIGIQSSKTRSALLCVMCQRIFLELLKRDGFSHLSFSVRDSN